MGYLIAGIAFALPLFFGVTGLGRPRFVVGTGGVLAAASVAVLLYVIWCGGLWLGLRLRRASTD